MDSIPDLPPEVVGQIINAVRSLYYAEEEEGTCNAAPFLSFVSKASLVSRAWASETRPFLFEDIVITFSSSHPSAAESTRGANVRAEKVAGSLFQWLRGVQKPTAPQAAERPFNRMEGLIELIGKNPRISNYAHRLHLHSENATGTPALNACALTLLKVCARLTELNDLCITWFYGDQVVGGLVGKWWTTDLNEDARSAFLTILRYPNVTTLKVENAIIPISLWAPHSPALLRLALHSSTWDQPLDYSANIPILPTSIHQSTLATPRAWSFSFLTHLTISNYSYDLEYIQMAILNARQTLLYLKCILACTVSGIDDKILDLSGLALLQDLTFCVYSKDCNPRQARRFFLRTVAELPLEHQIDSIDLTMAITCGTADPHNPLNVSGILRKLEQNIIKKVEQQPFGQYPRNITLSFQMDHALCSPCRDAQIHPGKPAFWQISNFVPKLYRRNRRKEVNLCVCVTLESPSRDARWTCLDYRYWPLSDRPSIVGSNELH